MKKYLLFLENNGCSKTIHSARNLMDHLCGTYGILKSWERPKHVCLAGLFHSIYGTPKFNTVCLDYTKRRSLVNLIGQKAELLVFFFSIFALDDIILAKVNKKEVTLLKSEMNIAITKLQYISLIEISIANFLEQVPHVANIDPNKIDQLNMLMELHRNTISPKAFHDYKRMIVS